jgi:transposase
MKRFIEGANRSQCLLLPEILDDYIAEDNPVRVIEAYIEKLDLAELGFKGVEPKDTGRPAYHPSTLLMIYIYGYLNRIHSSRRLEREAQRNVEVMWLTGRLTPDFKTIADFRKDNGKAIRNACQKFILLCRSLDLFSQSIITIDGSKFKAVNHRDKNFTRAKMKRRLEQIDKSLDKYMAKLEETDQVESVGIDLQTIKIKDKISALHEEMQRLKEIETEMLAAPDKQVSLTDPDSRSMKTRGQGIVGYNVQTAVDAEHHLIVAHEVTNEGTDRRQLTNMSILSKEALDQDDLTIIADRGYFRSEEILASYEAGFRPLVPTTYTSNNVAQGRFAKTDFIYIASDNEYLCPAGERLRYTGISTFDNKKHYSYTSKECKSCHIKTQCTKGKERRIRRWEHADVLDDMQARLEQATESMKIRRQTVEHPFGTIKAWMGATHFLTRTLGRVSTEMSLHILAYNMKRVINIVGINRLMDAIEA